MVSLGWPCRGGNFLIPMPLWLLLAPWIADVVISCGVQEVKTLEQKKMIGKFWKMRMGQMEGRWADGADGGGGREDERTGAWERTRCGQGGLADGRMGGRAGGLKGPAPHSPLHSLASRLLASLQSEFAGCLGVHWGRSQVYVFFFCSEQHICNLGTALLWSMCQNCFRIV